MDLHGRTSHHSITCLLAVVGYSMILGSFGSVMSGYLLISSLLSSLVMPMISCICIITRFGSLSLTTWGLIHLHGLIAFDFIGLIILGARVTAIGFLLYLANLVIHLLPMICRLLILFGFISYFIADQFYALKSISLPILLTY